MAEAHMEREHVNHWHGKYLWWPKRIDGKWHWRKTVFRRRISNMYARWWEYSFFPVPGAPIYHGVTGREIVPYNVPGNPQDAGTYAFNVEEGPPMKGRQGGSIIGPRGLYLPWR